MNFKEKVRDLLRKTPRPEAIDTINKTKEFKESYTRHTKAFKGGACSEQTAESIFKNLSAFH
jgi:hypothetical protein